MHDSETYEDPDVFRPERFMRDGKLDPNTRDPVPFVFGFGRRHVATRTAVPCTRSSHNILNLPRALFCSGHAIRQRCMCVACLRYSAPYRGRRAAYQGRARPIRYLCLVRVLTVPNREELLTGLLQLSRGLSLYHHAKVCDG